LKLLMAAVVAGGGVVMGLMAFMQQKVGDLLLHGCLRSARG
jgi:site-specific recombinase